MSKPWYYIPLPYHISITTQHSLVTTVVSHGESRSPTKYTSCQQPSTTYNHLAKQDFADSDTVGPCLVRVPHRRQPGT